MVWGDFLVGGPGPTFSELTVATIRNLDAESSTKGQLQGDCPALDWSEEPGFTE